MEKEELSLKRKFIVNTRRQFLRNFTRSLPNLQVLRRGWHKKMFIKVSFKRIYTYNIKSYFCVILCFILTLYKGA